MARTSLTDNDANAPYASADQHYQQQAHSEYREPMQQQSYQQPQYQQQPQQQQQQQLMLDPQQLQLLMHMDGMRRPQSAVDARSPPQSSSSSYYEQHVRPAQSFAYRPSPPPPPPAPVGPIDVGFDYDDGDDFQSLLVEKQRRRAEARCAAPTCATLTPVARAGGAARQHGRQRSAPLVV